MITAIAIDTGGTFCDLVLVDAEGSVVVDKAPSQPDNPAKGVFDVLEAMRARDQDSRAEFFRTIGSFALGTTIAINTVVTHRGARVGLLTTRGHGDMLSIMRVNGRVAGLPLQNIQNYYSTDKPPPLVPKTLICEINERIDTTGEVIVAMSDREVKEALDRLVAAGAETVAVSFLWSFLNPVHEQRVTQIAAEHHPHLSISLGSDLARRMGEYERTEAAVVNAYIAPEMRRYLDEVGESLLQRGVTAPFLVMNSVGGIGTKAHSKQLPIATLFSGPAGGVVATMRVAEAVGLDNMVCADVGGTTFDVGLIVAGRPLVRSSSILDQRVMFAPSIDITSIGAGGGSLARFDLQSRRLLVGPDSAGADPGPACYGLGGSMPTVTDANLVLGYMDPERFLGGAVPLDLKAAETAISKHVAEPLNVDVETAAAAIFSIVNAKMADLVRKVTVERGHDPRSFVLCAYGGLGPLHAPFFAPDLGVSAVMVPLGEISSVFSAYGIAMADILHIYEVSVVIQEPFSEAAINRSFAQIEQQAHQQLEADEIPSGRRTMRRYVGIRYVGQLNELLVEVTEMAGGNSAKDLRQRFERQYVDAFGPGAAWEQASVEIIGLRLDAIGQREKMPLLPRASGADARPVKRTQRSVYWPSQARRSATDIYDGASVGPGAAIDGPAVLEFATTTMPVPPGWRCKVDKLGNLFLRSADEKV